MPSVSSLDSGYLRHLLVEACVDVTSISSYSQKMIDIEHGYNRDGDNLRQFNFGMFCDEDTKMPLYYSRYNGSITDKTNLPYVLASIKDLGISHVKMILDGGFWDENCIKDLNKYCDAFTLGMPSSLNEASKILESYSTNIAVYDNELTYHHIYCVSIDTQIYDVSGRVLLYYDAYSHLRLCEELSDRIEMLKVELARLKRYPKSKLSRFTPYFNIVKHENDSGFDYSIDKGKVVKMKILSKA